ncbi:MAG: FMN-binding protein [Planctomycetota bacterium]
MSKIKLFIQESWLLIVSSFLFGLLLAVANAAWSPRIELNKIQKLDSLMSGLLRNAASFELTRQLQATSPKGKSLSVNLYKAIDEKGQTLGYCFNASGPGFADKIELVVALDEQLEKIAGFDVLASNETPGFGDQIKRDYYRNQFAGAPAQTLNLVKTGDPKKVDSEIVAITGATVSSNAVVEIINNILPQIKNAIEDKQPKQE